MARSDGVIPFSCDTIQEVAEFINKTKQTHAVNATQVFPPSEAIAKYTGLCYYAMKFPEGMVQE